MDKAGIILLIFIDINLIVSIICFIKLDTEEYRDRETDKILNKEIGVYAYIPISNIYLLIYLYKIKGK